VAAIFQQLSVRVSRPTKRYSYYKKSGGIAGRDGYRAKGTDLEVKISHANRPPIRAGLSRREDKVYNGPFAYKSRPAA